MSIALKSKIRSMCLAACHQIVSLYSIYCNPKLETRCPSPSNLKCNPCALPTPWKCSPLLDPLHFLEQRPILRPQTQHLVHMHGHRHVVDNHTKVHRIIASTMSKAKPKKNSNGRRCTSEGGGWPGGGRGGQPCWKPAGKPGICPGWSRGRNPSWTSGWTPCGQVGEISPGSGHARVGCPNLCFFWGCPCPPPWEVQRSSGVFRETRGAPTQSVPRFQLHEKSKSIIVCYLQIYGWLTTVQCQLEVYGWGVVVSNNVRVFWWCKWLFQMQFTFIFEKSLEVDIIYIEYGI